MNGARIFSENTEIIHVFCNCGWYDLESSLFGGYTQDVTSQGYHRICRGHNQLFGGMVCELGEIVEDWRGDLLVCKDVLRSA